MKFDYDFTGLPRTTHRPRPSLWLVLIVMPVFILFVIPIGLIIVSPNNIDAALRTMYAVAAVYAALFAWVWLQRRGGGAAFGRANNLANKAALPTPPLLAQIEGDGRELTAVYELSLPSGVVTTFDFSIVATKILARYRKYYSGATFSLPVALPHLYINSRRNRFGFATYQKAQRFVPEGPFNDVFETFLPDGQQVDVLSVLTPDVMACLLDYAHDYDIELIGHDVYLYADCPIYTQAALPRLLTCATELQNQLSHRAATWHSPALTSPLPPLRPSAWRQHWLAVSLTVGLFVIAFLLMILPAFL